MDTFGQFYSKVPAKFDFAKREILRPKKVGKTV